VTDISQWLHSLGLGQYAHAFIENAVEYDQLAKLTDDDLKEIGVKPLGHRKRILEAASLLEPGAGAPVRAADSPIESFQTAMASEAERRQLTVMFCDMVGSTELSVRLDPEEMRKVVNAFQDRCREVIERWEGHVARYMGDGVLVYFGYPQAHEEDAERAVRAGLDLVESIALLQTPAEKPLAVRVGIATGLVVVGDLIGEGSSREEAVVGETPNLAARLQGLAKPNSVVVGSNTRALLGETFELDDLSVRELKGFADPIRVYRVCGESEAEGRFQAHHGQGMSRLIGRDPEMQILRERWIEATAGAGQMLLLSGEAGIGKSRLVESLREDVSSESHIVLQYFGLPYYASSALHPMIAHLENTAGLKSEDTPETRLDKLEAVISAPGSDVDAAMPLLAALLSIPTDGRYPEIELTPKRQKERTFEVALDHLERLARRTPVLMLFEDVHWMDPSTIELLDLTVERITGLPVLMVLTFRPEFEAPWSGQPHVAELPLNRLTRQHGEAMVLGLTGGRALPEEVLQQVVERTDGVPLFVEELTKNVLESGLLTDVGDRYELAGPLPPLAIPVTLQDSLMARLDRLASVKSVAQIGSVIGREFSHELLSALLPMSEDELRKSLDQLIESELVFRRGIPPAVTYSFGHALIQDAAYQSLLISTRRLIHARIVSVLEKSFAEVVVGEPEVLAQHCTGAGLIEQAIGYWGKAGERAVQRSASTEAIRHVSRGLELVETLSLGRDRSRLELNLRMTLSPALMASKGHAAPEVGENFARAFELGETVGDTEAVFRSLWGAWRFHFIRADLAEALRLAERCVDSAENTQNVGFMIGARFAMGGSLIWSGANHTAEEQLQRAISSYDKEAHRSLAFQFGQDPGISSLAYSAWAAFLMGFPQQGLERSTEAIQAAENLGHPPTLAAISTYDAILHTYRRDWSRALSRADATIALSTEGGFPQHLAIGLIVRGRAMAEAGQVEEGIGETEHGIEIRRSIGANISRLFDFALLAEMHVMAGRADRALEVLGWAREHAVRTEEGFCQPEIFRVEGDVVAGSSRSDRYAAAEACYRRAWEIAQAQGSLSLVLRAVMQLSRLMADAGEASNAVDLLEPVYDQFTEGFDTTDLNSARTFIQEIRGTSTQ